MPFAYTFAYTTAPHASTAECSEVDAKIVAIIVVLAEITGLTDLVGFDLRRAWYSENARSQRLVEVSTNG